MHPLWRLFTHGPADSSTNPPTSCGECKLPSYNHDFILRTNHRSLPRAFDRLFLGMIRPWLVMLVAVLAGERQHPWNTWNCLNSLRCFLFNGQPVFVADVVPARWFLYPQACLSSSHSNPRPLSVLLVLSIVLFPINAGLVVSKPVSISFGLLVAAASCFPAYRLELVLGQDAVVKSFPKHLTPGFHANDRYAPIGLAGSTPCLC